MAYSNNNSRAAVKKFNGNSWELVGIDGFSENAAYYESIVLDQKGTPYVAFQDFKYNYGATVMKFDGNSWVNVGIPGFSIKQVSQIKIAIDNNDSLYVADRKSVV